ncbi:MAG TPA: hypothetical protein VFP44_03270, partial [Usitatibacter sp.]|nr:hypothetical protein [Usitatibacter sp.]
MLETFRKALPFREAPEFLAGGGEMGERMRDLQWSRTPLGSPDEWPETLRHAVRLVLASRQPMSLWWGDALVHLYNDACRPILGASHPSALGLEARVVWGDLWHDLGPRADAAMRRHEGSSSAPLPFIVERQGRAFETHYVMACNAIRGEHGGFGGVLWTFADATEAVLRAREMACVATLAGAFAGASDLREVCRRACEAIGSDASDIPFAGAYV